MKIFLSMFVEATKHERNEPQMLILKKDNTEVSQLTRPDFNSPQIFRELYQKSFDFLITKEVVQSDKGVVQPDTSVHHFTLIFK